MGQSSRGQLSGGQLVSSGVIVWGAIIAIASRLSCECNKQRTKKTSSKKFTVSQSWNWAGETPVSHREIPADFSEFTSGWEQDEQGNRNRTRKDYFFRLWLPLHYKKEKFEFLGLLEHLVIRGSPGEETNLLLTGKKLSENVIQDIASRFNEKQTKTAGKTNKIATRGNSNNFKNNT